MTQPKENGHENLCIVHGGLHIQFETVRNISAMDAKTRKTILNTTDLLAEVNLALTVASSDGDWEDSAQRRPKLSRYTLP